MNQELQFLNDRLVTAKIPEEVFGEIKGREDERFANLKRVYHQLAKVAHPDIYRTAEDRALAEMAFDRLTTWFSGAEARIRDGVYGKSAWSAAQQTILLKTRTREYHIDAAFETGSVYNFYPCTFKDKRGLVQATLKMVREPQDNDLAVNEARLLRRVVDGLLTGRDAANYSAYFPTLVDSFAYSDDGMMHQANVFEREAGWYSLEQVRQAYPAGIDPKDMAWIWRRLLVALGYAHRSGVIHGAVLPTNIWILPGLHGLKLEEWSFAAYDPEITGETISATDPAYEAWYPAEVLAQEPPLPGTDIGMAASCMIYLLGGSPINRLLPARIPTPITNFLRGCTLSGKRARPQDAWALKEEFDALLEQLWGERKFHSFTMPVNP